VRTFILTLDSVQHLSTLDQGRSGTYFSSASFHSWSGSFPTDVIWFVLNHCSRDWIDATHVACLLSALWWATVGPVHTGVRFKAQVHPNDDGPGLVGTLPSNRRSL